MFGSRSLIALAAVAPVLDAQAPSRFPQAAGVVAIESVTVIPMEGPRVLERQTVIVRDGRVAALGPAARVRVPAGATRVSGARRFLIPGLAEMHGHIPTQPELAERVLLLFAANGITTVRGMLGAPLHLELRDRIARGELTGPVLWLAAPALGGRIQRADTAVRLVEQYRAQGYDLLKIQEGLPRDVYDSVVAAAARVGMPWGGHVPDDVGLARVLEARQRTVDHLDNYEPALRQSDFPGVAGWPSMTLPQRMDALAQATKAAGVAVVPTMVLWEILVAGGDSAVLGARPENRYMPPQMVAQWKQVAATNAARAAPDASVTLQRRKDMLLALRRAGATILMGTDAPQIFSVPGYSIHRELEFLAALGFTPYELIESGTRRVADHFGVGGEIGVVRVGARANLVLLDADPLADIGNLRRLAGVMIGGRWLTAAELRSRLEPPGT